MGASAAKLDVGVHVLKQPIMGIKYLWQAESQDFIYRRCVALVEVPTRATVVVPQDKRVGMRASALVTKRIWPIADLSAACECGHSPIFRQKYWVGETASENDVCTDIEAAWGRGLHFYPTVDALQAVWGEKAMAATTVRNERIAMRAYPSLSALKAWEDDTLKQVD